MNNDEYQKLFKRLMKIANIDEVVCEKDLFDDYVFHIKSSRLKIMRSQMLYYKRTIYLFYLVLLPTHGCLAWIYVQ